MVLLIPSSHLRQRCHNVTERENDGMALPVVSQPRNDAACGDGSRALHVHATFSLDALEGSPHAEIRAGMAPAVRVCEHGWH